jgi:hypothetical protein
MDDHESTQATPDQPHIAGAYLPEEPQAPGSGEGHASSGAHEAEHAQNPEEHLDGRFHLGHAYRRHFAGNPRRERAFLHAIGFTAGFAGCRITTHAIRDNWGPFKNMSVGGRHLHHSTFGIIGQIGIGYLWTYQYALGVQGQHHAASRTTSLLSGIATALTLDEFALWFDLQDDYWDSAGRKSIDAVALFGGVSAIGLSGRGLVAECARELRRNLKLVGGRSH